VHINDTGTKGRHYQEGKEVHCHSKNGDKLLLEDQNFQSEEWKEITNIIE